MNVLAAPTVPRGLEFGLESLATAAPDPRRDAVDAFVRSGAALTGPSREWAAEVAPRLLSMIMVFDLRAAEAAGRPTRDVTCFEAAAAAAAAAARRVGILLTRWDSGQPWRR